MISEEFYRNRYLHSVLRLTRSIPIITRRVKDAMRVAGGDDLRRRDRLRFSRG
jgi:hypothetical protein